MAGYAGSISFDTRIDASGAQKGLDSLGGIVKASGVLKALQAGLDMIKASFDKAFSRMDTADQFSRVMTTMTGSTERANKALETTSQIVTGTAYGLDTASAAVQNFVSRGMTVTQATNALASWGDAVAFYGDGTDETLGRVGDAFAKMLTKGTVSTQQINSILESGIPVVEIYAQAVGKSTAEVSAAISSGSLNAIEFMEVLNTAFAEGTEGFPSVANAAKEAGSSWAGTFANMRAAVARGTEAIIKAIDEALAAIGAPDIKTIISNIGKFMEQSMKKAASAITPVIQLMVRFAPVIAGVAAAMLAYQLIVGVFVPIITAFKTAQELATAAVLNYEAGTKAAALVSGGMTIAQAALAAIQMVVAGGFGVAGAAAKFFGAAVNTALGPIGWIIIAIGAVVAAITALVSWWNKASAEQEAYAEESDAANKKIISGLDATTAAFDNAQTAYEDMLGAAEKTAKGNDLIIDSLADLASKSSLTATEMAEMESLIDQLNNNIPELGLAYDANAKSLNLTTEELKAYNTEQKQSTSDEALIQKWEETTDALDKTNKSMADLKQRLKDLDEAEEANLIKGDKAKEQREELNDAIRDASKAQADYGNAITSMSKDVEMALQRQKDSEVRARLEQQAAIQNLVDTYYLSYSEAEDLLNQYDGNLRAALAEEKAALEEQAKAVEDFGKAWGLMPQQVQDVLRSTGLTFDELSKQVDNFQKEFDNSVGNVINGFKLIVDESDLTAWEMMQNWQKNIEATRNWPTILDEVEAAFGPKGRQIAESMGIEYSSTLKEIMNDPELSEAFRQNVEATYEVGLEQAYASSSDPGWQEAGQIVSGETAQGVTNGAPEVEQAVTDMVQTDPTGAAQAYAPIYNSAGEIIGYEVATGATEAAGDIPADMADAVSNSVGIMGTAGTEITSALGSALDAGLANMPGKFQTLMTKCASKITSGATGVKTAWTSMQNAVKNTMQPWSTSLQNLTTAAVAAIARAITAGQPSVRAAAQGLTTSFQGGLVNMYQYGYNAGAQGVNGMVNGLANNASRVYNQANTIANNVSTTIKNALQVQSPSRVMMDIFGYVVEGMVVGLQDNAPSLYKEAEEIIEKMEDILVLEPEFLKTATGQLFRATASAPVAMSTGLAASAVTRNPGGTTYVDNSENNFYNPRALSEAEQTREMIYQKRAFRWNL